MKIHKLCKKYFFMYTAGLYSNRSGQWGVEISATLAPDRETANLVSCPLVVSSNVVYPALNSTRPCGPPRKTWTVGPAQGMNVDCWVGTHLSKILCVGEIYPRYSAIWVDCEDAFFVSRVIILFSGERRCPGDSDSLLLVFIQYIISFYLHGIIKRALQ